MKKWPYVSLIFMLAITNCMPMIARTSSLYSFESCGICAKNIAENEPVEVFFAPKSEVAHKACFDSIRFALDAADQKLISTFPLDPVFRMQWFRNAYQELIRRVQLAAEPRTILIYAKKEGLVKLKELFDKSTEPAIQHGLSEKAKAQAEARRIQE